MQLPANELCLINMASWVVKFYLGQIGLKVTWEYLTIVLLRIVIWRSHSGMPHTFNWESGKIISIGVTFQGPGTSIQNE